MKRIVVMVLLVEGCATPYQTMGFRGGYEDHPIGNGIISIHVRGNGYTGAGTVLEYAYRRAGEVCPTGFDAVDGQGSTSSSWQRNGNIVSQVDKHEMTVLVRCREPVAVAPAPEQPERQPAPVSSDRDPHDSPHGRAIVNGTQPVYCTALTTDADVGLCFLQGPACDAEHVRQGDSSTECKAQPNSACFNAKRALDDSKVTVCSVSLKDCERRLAAHRADVDFVVDEEACGIYRSGGSGQ